MKKKRILLIMIGILLLTGCKSKAVKNTEKAIDNIGTVNLESENLINEALENYDALTERQKDEVENYKILVDAQKQFSFLKEENEAKNKAAEISKLINELELQPCRKQADIDKLNNLYESLKDEFKGLVSNAEKIEKINELTEYEKFALTAANEVKNNLKSSGSFKLKEATVIKCTSKAISPYFVSVRYSGTNSFGGELDSSSFVDINKEGKSVWWSMSALLGGLKENELLLYNDSLKYKQEEYKIDIERIIRKMNE